LKSAAFTSLARRDAWEPQTRVNHKGREEHKESTQVDAIFGDESSDPAPRMSTELNLVSSLCPSCPLWFLLAAAGRAVPFQPNGAKLGWREICITLP
jgi:hypothetical protein